MWLSRNPREPRGQMLVIVALALTALVAMAGLVIDGGMAWSNRRQVQNASDAASLAGTRVLGLDLKWRAVNAGNPSPPAAPFPDPDAAVCDAINNALDYNTNSQQTIQDIDCVAGSDDAVYVDFDRNVLGRVGDGIPSAAQGVRVVGRGESGTFLMGVVGISEMTVAADATALAGPAAPPLGQLMPFVVQNPLSPFIPGEEYEVRSESEGECGVAVLEETLAEFGDIVFASYVDDGQPDVVLAAPGQPSVPIADPPSQTFTASITVTLTAENGAKIWYTTDGSDPTISPTRLEYNTALTFTATTVLKAVADKGSKYSDVGNYTYTQGTPPDAVTATATPDGGASTTDAFVTFITNVSVTLGSSGGATIHYTTDGTDPTTGSTVYTGALAFTTSTQLKAFAIAGGIPSGISTFQYTQDGDTQPPVADPPGGEFETSLNVTLTSGTADATIYYTVDGSTPDDTSSEYTGPLSLVATTTVRAIAISPTSGDSAITEFVFTKTGVTCPDLSAGNFGWVDFSGGSNSNADLIDDIENPENADIDWYYDECTGPEGTNCRDRHDASDPADDHWLLEGTSGHRNVALRTACDLYLGQVIYVPIWDGFETITKTANGNNAVFHLIGFAAFRLDGIIDNKNNGDPSGDACGEGLSMGGTPNDKGFVGTYVDSFVGTQVAPCIPSADGTNPCANLSNDAFTINLAK